MTRPPVLAGAVFGLSLIAARFVEAEAPPVEPRPVEELCRELEKTIASMPALAVDYAYRSEPDEEYHRREGLPITAFSFQYRWRAAGEKFYLRVDERFMGAEAPAPPRYAYVFDGVTSYHVRTGDPGGEEARFSSKVFQSYAVANKPTVQLGTGLKVGKPTLLEALRSPAAEAIRVEEVAGAPCHRVEIRAVEADPELSSIPLWVTVWLDPAKGMLPRRLREVYDPVELDRAVASGEMKAESRDRLREAKFEWETEEFMRVPNPAAEGGRSWFPKRAVFRQRNGRHVLAVDSVELRKEPAEDWFRATVNEVAP